MDRSAQSSSNAEDSRPLPLLAAGCEDRPPDGHFGRIIRFLQANDIVIGSAQPRIDIGGSRIVIIAFGWIGAQHVGIARDAAYAGPPSLTLP